MRYTYTLRYLAHTPCSGPVVIPDQVARNQTAYDGRTFPVRRRGALGVVRHARARLRGDLYGLGTPGCGDPVVTLC